MKVSAGAMVATLGLIAVAAGLTSSCNLVVDASPDSCTTDADCVNLANTGCDVEQGICVSLDKCQSNSECTGDYEICRQFSPRVCVSLKTPPPTDPADEDSTEPNCQTVYPDDPAVWGDDSTILIGLTAPRSYMGEPSIDTITNGAILALDEINEKGGVNNTQKLALVVCDDFGNANFAANNGRALAAMGVQSMIGAAYSGQTIEMATPESGDPGTVAAGVLAISPSATSSDVTGVVDRAPACVSECAGNTECETECPGLLWRTSPSDKIQGDAINKYFEGLEGVVKARTGTNQPTIKVTILHKGDSYGKGLAEFVKTGLEFNGMKANLQTSNFKVRDYGESATPDAAVIADAIADQADVYMIFCTFTELGGTPGVPNEGVIHDIETGWMDVDPLTRPFYVLADGGLNGEMLNDITEEGVEARVRGTVPGTASDNSLFVNFKAAYSERFPDKTVDGDPQTFGSAGAYDALYMLTYSAIAAKANALTGEQLARGLPLMADVTNGNIILAGPLAFGDASNDLQAGLGINYEGASGPLDFDPQTDEASSDIQIWCVESDATAPFSGRYFDAKSGTMKGPLDPAIIPANAACPFP